jgi:broad specificity phosphatase PhoE
VIWLTRHGQTEFNREGRYQGARDSALTELGREQGRRMGALLAKLVEDRETIRIVSSPLGRARHTAELIALSLGRPGPIETDPRLAEISLGQWDGLTDEDIEGHSPGARVGLNRFDWFFHGPDGERFDGFAARLGDWLDETVKAGVPTLAVSHGVAGAVLRGLHGGLTREEMMKGHAPQDAVFRLHADGQVIQFDPD